jgi:phthiocerol/phenolphthiocerol synthesis type-I polyketide synthase E
MSAGSLDIAIIGMAGRFPGARNVDELWRNLCEGKESIARLGDAELRAAGVDPALSARPDYVRAQAVLPEIDLFDAAFFGFSAQEAAQLDPQHRVFLECAFEAFESAGLDPERLDARVGVYAGSSLNGYLFHVLRPGGRVESAADMSALLALDKDFLATRVSYKLNLRGPSMAVQTACSTSLVAVHLACQALLLEECELALAGGVSISVPQGAGYLYQEGGIASPDGHCRPFAAAARGTVAASGAGIVLLRRLDDALAAGDPIVALIKGSAINNDGREKVGFTAPSVSGQARVIRAAQRAADVPAASIGYLEAHGTGTPLGDPIEIAALTQAFGPRSEHGPHCAIGSLKSNLGHLDAAAGVAGLIKAALALRHGKVPPSLHFDAPNPVIDFASAPFFVARELMDFPCVPGAARRAGVSSFGIGGTNAHVVLEQAPPAAPSDEEPCGPVQLCVSARSARGLEQARAALADALSREPALSLSDVAHTLRHGRRAFAQRWVGIADSRAAAIAALRAIDQGERGVAGEPRPLVFMFPGQGSQQTGSGRLLYEESEVFRAEIDRCATLLSPALGLDLRGLLFPPPAQVAEAQRKLGETAVTQPATFVLSYALARHLLARGLAPVTWIGHSVGEYVAACLGGALTLADALGLVALRGRLLQGLPEGAMLAVAASESELTPYLCAELALAALNGPQSSVLSGTPAAIAELESELSRRGVAVRRVSVNRAFHSPAMDAAAPTLRAALGRVAWREPALAWVSNVTGTLITRAEAGDPAYWLRHMREPVRFQRGVESILAAHPDALLLEVGSGAALSGMCRAIAPQPRAAALPLLAGADRGALALDGLLWAHGVDLAPRERKHGRRVALPSTPFERTRHWIDAPAAAPADELPLTDVAAWLHAPCWQRAAAVEPVLDLPGAGERWLLCSDDDELAQAFARRVPNLVRVRSGEHLSGIGTSEVTLPLDDVAAYRALVEALGDGPVCAVHAFGLGSDELVHAQRRGLGSLCWLARALGERRAQARLIALSAGACEVLGVERVQPAHALLLGAARSIARELEQVTCRVLDLEGEPAQPAACDQVAAAVLSEARLERDDVLVALRGAYRWLPGIAPQPPLEGRPTACRTSGVYLITGGLGALGLLLARRLVETLRARVVLVARSTPNEAQSAELARLTAAGAELLVCQADVCDLEGMRAVLARAVARFGALHGVIHAAGSAQGGLLETLDAAALARALAAKAQGALVLHELAREHAFEFIAYCSSLTALSGGMGQVGYAAANAFLDSHAHWATRAGVRTLSIALDRFEGIGMAKQAAEQLARAGLGQLRLEGMDAAKGVEALLLSLTLLPAAHVVVSRRRLRRLPEDEVAAAYALHQRTGLTAQARVESDDPLVIEDAMAQLWESAFGMAPIDRRANFYALGGESLLALSLLHRVRETFAVELPLARLFEHPSVEALARAVCEARCVGGAAAQRRDEPELVALPRAARKLAPSGGRP